MTAVNKDSGSRGVCGEGSKGIGYKVDSVGSRGGSGGMAAEKVRVKGNGKHACPKIN